MAKNLKNFRRDLNRVKISTLYSGPAKAAEKVVTELQEAGHLGRDCILIHGKLK